MANKPVVVYGASGYTGRLVCKDLASRDIPFVASGRNQDRLDEFVKELGFSGASAVAVEHNKEALTGLFQGSEVVISVAGPFTELGRPVAEACLDAKCHYMDTTGEQNFMLDLQRDLGEKFEKEKKVMISACAQLWSAGTCAAEVALETKGVDSITMLAYPTGGIQTVASLKSMLRFYRRPRYRLENRKLTLIPNTERFNRVKVPSLSIEVDAPVIGGGDATYFLNDPRVKNNQTLFGAWSPFLNTWTSMQDFAPLDMVDRWTDEYVDAVKKTPPPEDPNNSGFIIAAWGTGEGVSSLCVIDGRMPYVLTGFLCAEAASRCLEGKMKRTGYVSIAQAFGARSILKAMEKVGNKVIQP